jgi:hypothetical protein
VATPFASGATTDQKPYPAVSCAGHPRDQAGYVTDGTPQCEGPQGPPGNPLQWCAGTPDQKDACDAAMHHGFITSGRPQLSKDYCTGNPSQVQACDNAYDQAHPQAHTASTGSTSAQSDLGRRISGCESGGGRDNPPNWTEWNSGGSGASGGYQDMGPTWRGWESKYGSQGVMTSNAADAPAWYQIEVNEAAIRNEGTGPWDSSRYCWG